MCCFPAERISSVMARDGGDDNAGAPLRPAGVTLLLAGNIGSGKSATANSILGREAFVSKRSFGSVTDSCQMESGTLHDSRTVNVIDTPGLLNTASVTVDVGKVAMECMSMAKDGIHAVLVVFSATSRFSEEDATAVKSIKRMFGERMVLVFTHGDEVGQNEFKDMMSDAPEYMKELVRLCEDRVILFDNRTNDSWIQAEQCKVLLDKVDSIMIDHQEHPLSGQIHPVIKEDPEEKEEGAGHKVDSVIMTDHQGHPFSEQMHPIFKEDSEVKETGADHKVDTVMTDHQGHPLSDRGNDAGIMEDQEVKEGKSNSKGYLKITNPEAKHEVLKPWYVQTCEQLAYVAQLVWDKIQRFCHKVANAITDTFSTTKEQLKAGIVSSCEEMQRGWQQKPKMIKLD